MSILVNGPILPGFIADRLGELELATQTGANSFFLGRVRADGQPSSQVTGIDYSAYETMAAKVASDLAAEAQEKFGVQEVAIYHSTGLVKAGEVSLMVIVSSGHRRESFEALKWVVDNLKVRFPAWKKEYLADGGHRWVGEPQQPPHP